MSNILYDYFRSSAAYRVRIALNLKGVEAEQLYINLTPGVDQQHSKDYRKLNPQGRVPLFCETADEDHETDFLLGQSTAILEYLEDVYPEPALLPSDPKLKAKVRQLVSIIACDIHPLNNLSVLGYLKNELSADEAAVNKWYCNWIHQGFNAVEAMLNTMEHKGPFCFGEKLTMADCYLIPQVFNARRFSVPIDGYPEILRIDEYCKTLEAFQKAAPEKQADSK